MKKFLSCVLAMALVFSLMSMTVFAATYDYPAGGKVTAPGDYDVIGTHGTPDVNDGADVGSFTQGSLSSDINVNFNVSDNNGNTGAAGNNTIVHKYAIDITYAELIFDLTKTQTTVTVDGTPETVYQVWDVNTHTYVECYWDEATAKYKTIADAIADPSVEVTTEIVEPLTVENAFKVTNHSDLGVTYAVSLTNEKSANLKFKFTYNDGIQDQEIDEVAGVVTVSDTDIDAVLSGTAAVDSPVYALTVSPATGDWNDTINALHPAAGTATFKVASITITVKPAA